MVLSKRQLFLLLTAASTFISVAAQPLKVLSTQPIPGNGVQQMNILQAIILGFVQGVTEFLPISSTAHLKVVPVVLGWGDPGVAFTAIIQLGSIAAVLWYFRLDLTRLLKGGWSAIARKDYADYDLRLCLGILLGTLPIVFFGLLIKNFIPDFDNSPIRSLAAIAIASIVMSLLLGLAEILGKRQRDFEHLTMKDGLLMGLAQSLALIPGVSRSGSTLTSGLFIGLQRETAARFSFLLGIPAITLAGLVELKDVLEQGVADAGIASLVVGVISSAVFSYLAIAGLLRFLKTHSNWVFIWYRLIFGILILAAIRMGLLINS
ncbi:MULTISPECIES: undecaprenyl-diphosphate phosphatase [Fischerella]|uniref:Undecaprenyl-diphosphatase n=1 Tax=Fischerella muscicola CCMEE 5323 TaxID=2019572 RepID=A0A2N6K6F7_FISMU|nr:MULTISPECIES: undecaprenyl-diphosphate phosphatase [Fischerella]MBD2433258.1 undecaprenyl-diphosphate phosphatase [Fischerella sp. FACHB-380]PLZ92500.1 undecaprenyl-diphosphate phosphatase [Fischerella muscicola CCMEE 5323]